MKKTAPFLLFVLMAFTINAQNSVKKYVLMEHFTNSKCSICASKNPAFYSLIQQAQYASDIHHIAVHPSVPYNTCVFYLANTTENNAWSNIYLIQGTPRLALNGTLINASSQLLPPATLQTYLGQTSPLYLKVTESNSGNPRSVTIDAKAFGEIPAGNYKIFVAVVEKTINQVTPNGEAVHHDVFRKMLTEVTGDAFQAPAVGQSAQYNFQYELSPSWNAEEVYVLAFVKNMDTKVVLNSGTRFDAVISGTSLTEVAPLHIQPNPATDAAWLSLSGDEAQTVEVFAANGQRVAVSFEKQSEGVTLSLASLARGVYFVKITGAKSTYVGKFVKE